MLALCRYVELMGFLASLASDQIEREERELTDRRSHVELAGIHALLSALTARDHYTGEHSQTVVRLAREAGMAGLSADVLDALLPRMTPAWERRGGSDGARLLWERSAPPVGVVAPT